MRSVVVDAAALESKQDEFFAAKGTSIATGLVVGRMTAAKDYIVALIETPDIDGSDAGGGKNWDSVDESWIVEHAKEVQRMMPGGMMVMGIYFFCPSEQVAVGAAKSSMAYSILRKIARLQAAVQAGEAEGERLLLHVCSKTKRVTCKAFQVKDASKGGHPAEMKTAADLSSLFVRASSRFGFSFSLTLPVKGSADTPSDPKGLSSFILNQVREQLNLSSTVATVDGVLVSDEAMGGGEGGGGGSKGKGKGKGKGGGAGSGGVEPFEVSLFSRSRVGQGDGAGLRARGGGGAVVVETSGRDVVRVEGEMEAVASVLMTESQAAAADAIRQDIASSLSTRLLMLLEDWALLEEEEEEGASQSLRHAWLQGKRGAWALPRRLQFTLGAQIRLCPHVLAPDGPKEALENVKQMLVGLQTIKAASEPAGFFDAEEAAPALPDCAALPHAANTSTSNRSKDANKSPSVPAPSSSAGAAAAGGGASAGSGMGNGVLALAALAGLYALELFFDVLPFI
jgi:hypothetical protein